MNTKELGRDNVKIFETPESLAKGFAQIFSDKISELLKDKSELSIALSGGKTPIEMYKILATDYKDKIDWNKLNFYWVDERCVEPGSPESNFGNAYNTLFRNINISPARLHRIKGEADPVKEAQRYSELVQHNVPALGSLPSFDIILLGIGDDGHTASIFPDQINLFTSEKLYDTAIHPKTGNKRITMTGNLINNAKCIYFLVSGSEKAVVVNSILYNYKDAKDYPAYYIKPVSGEIYWMIVKVLSVKK